MILLYKLNTMEYKMNLLELLFNKYEKTQLRPDETAEAVNRSVYSLRDDRKAGIGIGYIKIGKGQSGKIYYPLQEIVNFLENSTIKTA